MRGPVSNFVFKDILVTSPDGLKACHAVAAVFPDALAANLHRTSDPKQPG